MFFKNLLFYRLPKDWSISMGQLEALLEQHPLLEPSSASMRSVGWVPAGPEGQYVVAHERHLLIAFGMAKRVLPSPVVKQEVARRAIELEKNQGYAPGKKQLRDLKDQVLHDLTPKAFIQRSSLRAWIDQRAGLIVVDTTSLPKAEDLITTLRHLLEDGLAATFVDTKLSPSEAMTLWLKVSEVPPPFAVADGGELVGADVSKPTVRYVHHDLEGRADVIKHINEGKKVTKLSLVWRERATFVLTQKLQVTGLKLAIDPEREAADFQTDFVLMTSEYRDLIHDLIEALGGETADTQSGDAGEAAAEHEHTALEEAA